jgi:hypothetical protein
MEIALKGPFQMDRLMQMLCVYFVFENHLLLVCPEGYREVFLLLYGLHRLREDDRWGS